MNEPKPVRSKAASKLPLGHFVFTPQNCKADQSTQSLALALPYAPRRAGCTLRFWVSIMTTTKRVEGQLGGARRWNASWTDERISQMLDATHKKFWKSRLASNSAAWGQRRKEPISSIDKQTFAACRQAAHIKAFCSSCVPVVFSLQIDSSSFRTESSREPFFDRCVHKCPHQSIHGCRDFKIFINKENTFLFFLIKLCLKKKILRHYSQCLCVSPWTGTPYAWTGNAGRVGLLVAGTRLEGKQKGPWDVPPSLRLLESAGNHL